MWSPVTSLVNLSGEYLFPVRYVPRYDDRTRWRSLWICTIRRGCCYYLCLIEGEHVDKENVAEDARGKYEPEASALRHT